MVRVGRVKTGAIFCGLHKCMTPNQKRLLRIVETNLQICDFRKYAQHEVVYELNSSENLYL